MNTKREPVDFAVDALTNCRGFAKEARSRVLELLGNLAAGYAGDDSSDLEELRPAFQALDALDGLIAEVDSGTRWAGGPSGAEGGAG